jgi:hypothetical protein
MTLPLVAIDGGPYEIGIALGRQSGGALSTLLETVARYRRLKEIWRGSERLVALETAARAAYPQYVRTIEGVADGAEMAFADLFLWNCRGDLPDKLDGDGTVGCTSVLFPGDGGGEAIIGHNEDGEREFDGHCFLAAISRREGVGFTSFCYPGLLPGHAFAVNECGLVQTINHIRANDMTVGIPRHLVTHAVISSKTLDEALTVLRRRDRASAFNHNLMQVGDPRVMSVEAPSSGCDIMAVSAPYAHANHLLRFPGHDQTVSLSSDDRQRRADDLISDSATNDPLRLLADREPGAWPICRKAKTGPDTGYTLATAIFAAGPDAVRWQVYTDMTVAPLYQGVVTPETVPA